MREPDVYVKLEDCVARHVYRLLSRNLTLGVFDPEASCSSNKGGFLGIREKRGSRFVFTEYHWDGGPPYGTAFPLEDVGIAPETIELAETIGTVDQETRRPVAFDRPVADGGRGWTFEDTGESSALIQATSVHNRALFDFLDTFPLEKR